MRFLTFFSILILSFVLNACKNDAGTSKKNDYIPQNRDVNSELDIAKTKVSNVSDSIINVGKQAEELLEKVKAVSEEEKAAVSTSYNYKTLEADLMRLQKNRSLLESQQKELANKIANMTGEGELSEAENSDDSPSEILDSYMYLYEKNKKKLEEMSTTIEEFNIMFEELSGKRPKLNVQ